MLNEKILSTPEKKSLAEKFPPKPPSLEFVKEPKIEDETIHSPHEKFTNFMENVTAYSKMAQRVNKYLLNPKTKLENVYLVGAYDSAKNNCLKLADKALQIANTYYEIQLLSGFNENAGESANRNYYNQREKLWQRIENLRNQFSTLENHLESNVEQVEIERTIENETAELSFDYESILENKQNIETYLDNLETQLVGLEAGLFTEARNNEVSEKIAEMRQELAKTEQELATISERLEKLIPNNPLRKKKDFKNQKGEKSPKNIFD